MSYKDGKDYLFLVWKAESTRRQFVVGQLSKNGQYEFNYCGEIQDAMKEGFAPLISFPNINQTYYSDELFSTFSSRLPDRKRKDIRAILEKYRLETYDAYELLKKSGARLPIDKLQFVDPIFDWNQPFKRTFYVAGARHYMGCEGQECNNAIELTRGDEVFLQKEPDNQVDCNAIKVLTEKNELVGYIPRYYSESITEMIDMRKDFRCFISAVEKSECCDECIALTFEVK